MSHLHTCTALAALLLLIPACGDDDGGGSDGGGASSNGGGSSNGGAGGTAACEEMEIHVWGTLNGEDIDVRAPATGHSTVLETTNISGDGLSVTLVSAAGWQFGGTEACNGAVTGLPLGAMGNCLTDAFSGERTVDDDGDGASFHLTAFTEENPASQEYTLERFCGGTAVTGELEGCVRF